jgi:excinuclease ABC subunit C
MCGGPDPSAASFMTAGRRRMIAALPVEPGVYRFRDGRGHVLYIGRATSLRSRVSSYWSDLRDRRHLAPMVASIQRVEALVCESVHEAAWLERNVLEAAMPRWNRTPGGQEVSLCIRMDRGPRSPGLRVVHNDRLIDRRHTFGPYLGGLQVRLAVAALHRVLPLAYAGTGLRGAEVEMARLRGIDATDRDRLADRVVAALERDPDTVAWARSELEALRDRASDALVFELAARIDAEMKAFAWVTSAQRVTAFANTDSTVYGWWDGVLVRYEIRAGRLSAWSQRACSHSRAQSYLAHTSPGWTDFAERNAQLAATLTAARGGQAG